MSDMEDGSGALKDAVRKLRGGGFVAGMDLVVMEGSEYLVAPKVAYRVHGQDRLRLVPVGSPVEEASVRKHLEDNGAYTPPDAAVVPVPVDGDPNGVQHLKAAPEGAQAGAGTAPAPQAQGKPRPVRGEAQGPRSEEVACSQCGATFTRSKFNPYFTACNACRKRDRRTGGQDRKFTCVKCGKEFWISKYQPYLNPDACPHCHRNANIRRRQKRVAADERAAKQNAGRDA